MSESRNIKVRTSGIRAIFAGFENFPMTVEEAEQTAWYLTQEWNPLLADAMIKNPPNTKLGGFHAYSVNALVATANKAGEQYPDCDLIFQWGAYSIMRRSTGRQENIKVLLLTVYKSEYERRNIVTGDSFNLTLIPD